MSRRLLATVAAAALTVGLAACGEGEGGTVTTPPPSIDTGQDDGASDAGGEEPSDAGGGEPSDAGGADDAGSGDGTAEAAPDIPAPDPADFPGMDEQTPEGAEQAFKYYWAVVLWGHQTGDSEPLAAVSAEECASCAEIVEDIDEIDEHSAYWSAAELTDVASSRNDPVGEYEYVFSYTFIVGAHSEPALDGGGTLEVPETTFGAAGALYWNGSRWVVADVSSAESDAGQS